MRAKAVHSGGKDGLLSHGRMDVPKVLAALDRWPPSSWPLCWFTAVGPPRPPVPQSSTCSPRSITQAPGLVLRELMDTHSQKHIPQKTGGVRRVKSVDKTAGQ